MKGTGKTYIMQAYVYQSGMSYRGAAHDHCAASPSSSITRFTAQRLHTYINGGRCNSLTSSYPWRRTMGATHLSVSLQGDAPQLCFPAETAAKNSSDARQTHTKNIAERV